MTNEPIAIIGMGCRYPQAADIDALWQLLLEGRDAIAPYPGGRFRELDTLYEETAAGGKALATHLGGFLPDVDRFDASFFGISPREAAFIDPQQRLLLEVSWNALEDAGQVRDKYQGSRTGVFTGLWATDYENHIFRHSDRPEFYLLTGGGRSTTCGRISFTFGFEGPSISVDTACSSSMVAIHLACQSLRQTECDMALAGGVNLILSVGFTRLFTNAGMLAPDGHCKFGDASANGFVRSEGAGMVVLKRLSDAIAAGDGIYAVIRGSAVNNDGKSSGLLVTPSREAQQAMLLDAWRQAGISGLDLSYIEAHGTGTHVGDPVEIGAISDALQKHGVRERIPIGSMKSNIGHTESAAGVAGLIKTALVLHHGVIPASLHCGTPNPEVDWQNGPIEVVQQTRALTPAPDGQRHMAGASSFGLTGTNAHVVLAEHKPKNNEEKSEAGKLEGFPSSYILPISAYTSTSLIQNAKKWLGLLDRGLASEDIAELSYLAGARRTHLQHRFAALGENTAELRTQIAALVAGEPSASPEAGMVTSAPVRVVFVAPGQGSQWDGMARDLLRESQVFRESLKACDQVISAETGWSLIERLEGPDAVHSLTEIDFVQPALFAMSVALATVWRAAGVTPDAVLGHSMGEVAAAYLAGVLTLEDAAAVICRRSRLMRELSGSGAMATVELPVGEMEQWLESFGGRISIAAENSPETTIVAGETAAVDQLLEWLELKEIFCRRIKVDVASHSALVDAILPALADELGAIKPQPGSLPFFSTVNGVITEGKDLNTAYWVRNLRQPVRLATATSALARDGYTCFIELSPHPILVPALENTLRGVTSPAFPSGAEASSPIVLSSLLRGNPAWPALLRSLGRYWIHGGQLDWAALSGRGAGPVSHRLRLPEYSFEQERFWPEESEGSAKDSAVTAQRLSPLLIGRTDSANDPGVSIFTVNADPGSLPYLNDHRVAGAIVFPAAAHLETALEAARLLAPGKRASLENVSFPQALYLSETEAQDLQLVVRKVVGKPENFTFSLMGRQGTGEGGWTEHSSGMIHLESSQEFPETSATFAHPARNSADARRGGAEEHYRKASRSGLQYGPSFQLVESFEVSHPMTQTRIRLDDNVRQPGYLVHPALLDSCFQAMLHLRPQSAAMSADDVYLPIHVGRLRVLQLPSELRARDNEKLIAEAAVLRADHNAATLEINLQLKTEAGQVLATLEAMTVKRVKTREGEGKAENLFVLDWKPLPSLAAPTPASSAGRHWLIFADSGEESESASYAVALARRHASLAGRCTLVWQGQQFRPLGAGDRRLDLLGADEYEIPLADKVALDTLLRLVAAEAGRISDIFDFWTLSQPAEGEDFLEALMHRQEAGTKFIPTLVQAITRAEWTNPPRLWLVTEGTQNLPNSPASASLAGSTVWGLGRALSREYPELQASLIDLSPVSHRRGPNPEEIEGVVRLALDQHRRDKVISTLEDRIAFRGNQGYAARALPCPLKVEDQLRRELARGEAFRIEIEQPGPLEGLQLRALSPTQLPPGEVSIDVTYAGLNFIDVTKALGIYPGLDPKELLQMGGECSGRVVAVGAGVETVKVGDEVVALTPSPTRTGLLASRVNIPAALVLPKPDRLSLAEAASQPIAYLTAHYALNELARLGKGEWILIHAGAGGVGLAAAQIALAQGAKVIATASSPEKHAFLHAWGVEHVLQSRSLDFADGVLEITGGRGVDVVLNSLAGDFIAKSLEVLAPYGRFVELGKRDIYEDRRVGLKAFVHNNAYFAVDLAALIEEKPDYAVQMFRDVMHAVETGRWAALPVRCFPASDPAAAFQFMAQGQHTGKLALEFEYLKNPQVLSPRAVGQRSLFKRDATYLLTGGLGGVGAVVAEWMAENGAGHLVLVSRRQAGPAEEELFCRIRASGAVVEHHRTDLLDLAAVEQLIAKIALTLPPLRGILHAAAVIDDALVDKLTPERFDAVFGPKIRGTWHLHQATLSLGLEMFVMFSSYASVCPQPGHGSYSAANSFMDAFAGYRRGLGLAASAINWAGWLGLGLARETGTRGTIDASNAEGFGSFEPNEALHLLGEALRADPVQVLAVRIDVDRLAAAHDGIPPLFKELAGQPYHSQPGNSAAGNSDHPYLDQLGAISTYAEKILKLEALLRTEVGRVLKLSPDRIASGQSFGRMGIDSLMALEFIRRVNGALGLALPATSVFNYPTIAMLAPQVAKRLGLDPGQSEDAVATASSRQTPKNGSDPTADPGRETQFQPGAEQRLSEDEALRTLMEPGDVARGD